MVVVRMGPGEGGGPFALRRALIVDVAEVCRLKMLGFLFALGIAGFTKEGDEGAEDC